jgi:hypothetical protein
MKNEKFPLPGRERVGEREIVEKCPLPFIFSHQGGIFFAIFMNRQG